MPSTAATNTQNPTRDLRLECPPVARPSGQVIRELRQKRGLTTHQLAQRAGVAERTLRNLEHEDTETPHPETIAALAGALRVEPEELFDAPTIRYRVAGWTAGATALLVMVGLGGWWLSRPAELPIRSIAVLPLVNLSGDPEQEYFADGMTEAFIRGLGRIGSWHVTSRTSVMRYKDTDKLLPEIARALGVDGVVEGTVMLVGNRIRITVQLIDARTDSQLWNKSYNRELSDVLALYGDVARAVAEQVRIELSPDEQAVLSASRRVDPRAYDAYLRGLQAQGERSFFQVAVWGPQAIEQYERAVQIDPGLAEAWAQLAMTRGLLSRLIGLSQNLLDAAWEAAERALELDDKLGLAHVAVGFVRENDWDLAGAQRAYDRAMQLSPNEPAALVLHVRGLVEWAGKTDEAIRLSARLPTLAPFEPGFRAERATVFHRARRHERALQEFGRVRELAPAYHDYEEMGAYVVLGRFEEAHRTSIAIARTCGASCAWELEALRRGWEEGGWEGSRRAWLAAATARPDTAPFRIAFLHATLGETEAAFRWLERCYRERQPVLNDIRTMSWLDPLRADPRFDDLLRRIGYPEASTDPGELAAVGLFLAQTGRSNAAIERLQDAMELSRDDPRLARWHYSMALAHFAAERYEQAMNSAERALDRNPGEYTTADAYLVLASSYAHLGRTDRARESLNEALRLWPGFEIELVPLPPYVNQGLRDRYVNGLRRAGLDG